MSSVSEAVPASGRQRRQPSRRSAGLVLWHVVCIIVTLAFVLPLAWMLATSLRSQDTALTGPLVPTSFTLDAYGYVFTQLHIWRNLLNSVVATGASVAITVVVSVLAGYAFGRLNFRGRGVAFTLLASSLFLPAVAILIPLYIELQAMGLLGGIPGLVAVYAASGVPFSVFLMRSFFEELPAELSEAARTDGANEFQTFFRVMMPLAAPGVATVAVFQLISVWNELLLANALVSDPASQPLQPSVNSLIGQYATNWPALTAGMTVSALPMLIAYVVFQRWFVAGLTAGAVKS